MLLKMFRALLLLSVTLQFVTCEVIDNCTPEMKKTCAEFCSLGTVETRCRTSRYVKNCYIKFEGKPMVCSPSAKVICGSFQPMIRCQDDIVGCRCNQVKAHQNGCFIVPVGNLINCPQYTLGNLSIYNDRI